jgi:iron complex outermembrane recepter protein
LKLNNLLWARFAAAGLLAILSLGALTAQAATTTFEIEPQDLSGALKTFAVQSHREIFFAPELTRGRKSNGVKGTFDDLKALNIILNGTGLDFSVTSSNAILIRDSTNKTGQSRQGGAPTTSTVGGADTSSTKMALANSTWDQSVGNASIPDSKSEDEEKGELDEVVVTGTHIRGVEAIGSPVLTITQQDIQQSGYQTVEQLLASLPQNFNGLSYAAGLGGAASQLATDNSDNATAIDLRGLGPQSTLTLIDGQRVAGAIQGRAVDVSLIPLAMIDHIDILTGGASSIYGADAVGGVANLVLRHSYDGAETLVNYGWTANGGDKLQFNQIFGHNFGSGGFLLAYDFARDAVFDAVRAHDVQPVSLQGVVQYLEPLQPEDHKNSVFLSGHWDAADNVELFTDASYMHKAQNVVSYYGIPSFQFLSNNATQQTNEEYNALGGVRIGMGSSWKLEISAASSVYINSMSESYDLTFGGSPFAGNLDKKARSSLLSGSAVADGDFISIFGVLTKAAFGVDVRRETLSTTTNESDTIPAAARTIGAAFGELHIPIVEHGSIAGLPALEVSLSARDDHYSDFGNTLNPQGGLLWRPIESLSVKGAYARAFRAPDLFTLDEGTTVSLEPWPVATPTNPNLTNQTALEASGGNPGLTAERATSWSLGLEYQIPATPVAKVSLSYFDINYIDRIADPIGTATEIVSALYPNTVVNLHPTPSQVLDLYNTGPFVGNDSGYPWNGNPQTLVNQIPNLFLLDDRYLNIAKEHLRGLDLIADGHADSPIGTITGSLNATKTITHYQQITPEVEPARLFNYVGYAPGFKARASGGLTYGPVGAFVFLNYTAGYINQFTVPYSTVGSWTTTDLTLIFNSGTQTEHRLFGGITVTAGIQNIFDRNPPRFEQNYQSGLLFDPANANGFGRVFSASIRKKW